MAEYSELIKRFDKIRNYMRDFYVYGFKSREDFSAKSLRSYDNEKRRIESYLSDVMTFRQDENGKNVFISLDSASITANPLYRAFKAKTFTKNDITLNFYILDILAEHHSLSVSEIADKIVDQYLSFFENSNIFDLSTVRNKLKEYEDLGILNAKKEGKKLLYNLNGNSTNISDICDVLIYFSEVSPLGVIGSFMLDKCENENKHFTFKHHYIMHALDSEITLSILNAIHEKKKIEIINFSPRAGKETKIVVTPLKFLISLQGGRRYISCHTQRTGSFTNYRIDYIKSVTVLDNCEDFDIHYKKLEEILTHTWGTSFSKAKHLEKLSLTLNITPKEEYIVHRINREGRGGSLSQIDENTYKYEIEVYDAREMMTFVRTFIGRIKKFECSNQQVADIFYNDLNALYEMYGGDSDAI